MSDREAVFLSTRSGEDEPGALNQHSNHIKIQVVLDTIASGNLYSVKKALCHPLDGGLICLPLSDLQAVCFLGKVEGAEMFIKRDRVSKTAACVIDLGSNK